MDKKKLIDKYSPEALRLAGVLRNDVFVGPRILSINITSKCNIKCEYCIFQHESIKKFIEHVCTNTEITTEKFKEIIDDCKELKVKRINFCGWGEPLVHPNIEKMVDYVDENGMMISFTTNGTLLTKLKNLDKVDSITISISAANEKTYEALHHGTKKLFDNIMHALDILSEREKPCVSLNFVITKMNYKEIPEILKLAASKKCVHYVYFKILEITPFNKHLIISESEIKNLKEIIKRSNTFGVDSNINEIYKIFSNKEFLRSGQNMNFSNARLIKKCYVPWYYTIIEADGSVAPCCRGYPIFTVGNIYMNSFKEIWFSNEFKKLRSEMKNSININEKKWENCRYCYHYSLNKEISEKIKRLKALE